MSAMTDARVARFAKLDLKFAPRPWPFARSRRAEIDANFARRKAERPALWNGQVLILYEQAEDGAVFRGSYLQTDYASFMSWIDWGLPAAGKSYVPAGPRDLSTRRGETVDRAASVWGEVGEETGLTSADLDAEPGWHTVFAGAQIAHLKIMQARQDAVALRERIVGFLGRQDQPELADIRIVRSLDDLEPAMLPFVGAFLRDQWPA